MSDNALKIRIKIHQPQPHAIEEFYPDPEVSYEQIWDWKKIGAAAVALLVLVIMLGRLLFGGSAAPQESLVSIPDETPAIAAQPVQPPETAQPSTAPVPVATTNKPVVKPARKPARNAAVNTRARTEQNVPKTAAKPKPRIASDRPEVLRAQLSHAVKAYEPVDSIDSVQLQRGESKPVYFYTHLKNLQGQNIRIAWYHNDKLDSHLSLQVHNNNWRTQASKQLDSRRLGAWRVELTDDAGNRLAARHFTVTQH